jgi:hypothetical protein
LREERRRNPGERRGSESERTKGTTDSHERASPTYRSRGASARRDQAPALSVPNGMIKWTAARVCQHEQLQAVSYLDCVTVKVSPAIVIVPLRRFGLPVYGASE